MMMAQVTNTQIEAQRSVEMGNTSVQSQYAQL